MNNDFRQFIKGLSLKNSFAPNLTSELLVQTVCTEVSILSSLLDVGSGSGAIALYCKEVFPNSKISGVESNKLSRDESQFNAANLNLHVEFFANDELTRLICTSPQVIVNDVTGISSEVAKLTRWFHHSDAPIDDDGITLSLDVFKRMRECSQYLDATTIYFPLISLCNRQKYLEELRDTWYLRCITQRDWPAPAELSTSDAISKLGQLRESNKISYRERFGKIIFDTQIWEAKIK
jgi:hypothetical protein